MARKQNRQRPASGRRPGGGAARHGSRQAEAAPGRAAVRPALVLVGADKGGVGKTTLTRLILDYLTARGVRVRAFDTEAPHGTLARFFPDITEIVDLTQTSGQIRVFDTIGEDADQVTVIDMRAGQMLALLRNLEEFGFTEAAGNGEVSFALFHILGSSIASLEEIAQVAPMAENASYFLVRNHAGDGTYFEWDPETYAGFFEEVGDAATIDIPKLNELAYEQVDLAGVPYSAFVENPANSFVLRGYVRSWLHKVFAALDEAGLDDALALGQRRFVRPPQA